jgi:hypothetical protein
MVAFADTSVLSRTYAAKTCSQVDPNQEMIGLGAANLAAGLFQGFPISSISRERTGFPRVTAILWTPDAFFLCCGRVLTLDSVGSDYC